MTRFFLPQNTEPPSGAASHRDLHAAWGGSEMHVRGCDCAECCPGTPAEATRVYATVGRRNERGCRQRELFPLRYDREPEAVEPVSDEPLWRVALLKRGSAE